MCIRDRKNTDEDSSSVDEPITGDEAGIYYFDADDAEYLISWKGNNVTLSLSDETLYGEYTFDGTELNLTFDGEGGGDGLRHVVGRCFDVELQRQYIQILKKGILQSYL